MWGKNPYDPDDPRWRHDYWGDPTNLKEEIRRDREPRVAPVVDETAAAEEEVEEEEETTEETADDQSTEAKKPTDRTTVNGTASAAGDDVRTMFTMPPQVCLVRFKFFIDLILCIPTVSSVKYRFSRILINKMTSRFTYCSLIFNNAFTESNWRI
jgi:hypothetical protein